MDNKYGIKIKDLRAKSSEELLALLEQAKFGLMADRGQLAKYKNQGKKGSANFSLRRDRRLVAQLLTILNERGIHAKDSMGRGQLEALQKASE